MGAEVPDDARVGLMKAEVDAARGDEVDLAQLAGGDQVSDRLDRRAVEEGVTRHQHQAEFLSQCGELRRFFQRARKRLLDERVLAGLERGACEWIVRADRRGDDHRLDLGVRQHLGELSRLTEAGVSAPDLRQCLGPGVAQVTRSA